MHARSKVGNAMSESCCEKHNTHAFEAGLCHQEIYGKYAEWEKWLQGCGVCVCVFSCYYCQREECVSFQTKAQDVCLNFHRKNNILKMMRSTFSPHIYDAFVLLLPKTLLDIEKLSRWKTFLHRKGHHPLSVSMQRIFVNVCHWKLRQGFSQGLNVPNLSYWYLLLDSVCSSAYCSRETSLSSFNFSHLNRCIKILKTSLQNLTAWNKLLLNIVILPVPIPLNCCFKQSFIFHFPHLHMLSNQFLLHSGFQLAGAYASYYTAKEE